MTYEEFNAIVKKYGCESPQAIKAAKIYEESILWQMRGLFENEITNNTL